SFPLSQKLNGNPKKRHTQINGLSSHRGEPLRELLPWTTVRFFRSATNKEATTGHDGQKYNLGFYIIDRGLRGVRSSSVARPPVVHICLGLKFYANGGGFIHHADLPTEVNLGLLSYEKMGGRRQDLQMVGDPWI